MEAIRKLHSPLSGKAEHPPPKLTRDLVLRGIYDRNSSFAGILDSDVDEVELLHLSKYCNHSTSNKNSLQGTTEYTCKRHIMSYEELSLEDVRQSLDRLANEEIRKVQWDDENCSEYGKCHSESLPSSVRY